MGSIGTSGSAAPCSLPGGEPLEAIGFNLFTRLPPEEWGGGRVDAAFHLTVNEYRGRRTPQLKLLDVRRSDAAPAP